MRITECCAACMYNKQAKQTNNESYLAEVRSMIENRSEDMTSPYMTYRFNQLYERYFGKKPGFGEQKKLFNDLALSLEEDVRRQIRASKDPLKTALFLARTGNYIDFGALSNVDPDTFLKMLKDIKISENDEKTYEAFCSACARAGKFLLLADNCGEIVFDKLLIEQLGRTFPQMEISVMVRDAEVLNDVTPEEAAYVGIDQVARILTNGNAVAGTVYHMLPETSRKAVDEADVILSKGQGNYETFSGHEQHAFYLFLCKCSLFMERFAVPKLTGLFIEE